MFTYHVSGTIFTKETINEQLKEEAISLLTPEEIYSKYRIEDNCIQFYLYISWQFENLLSKWLEQHLNEIESGEIYFTCYDEDHGEDVIRYQIIENHINRQSMTNILPPEWNCRVNHDWFNDIENGQD